MVAPIDGQHMAEGWILNYSLMDCKILDSSTSFSWKPLWRCVAELWGSLKVVSRVGKAAFGQDLWILSWGEVFQCSQVILNYCLTITCTRHPQWRIQQPHDKPQDCESVSVCSTVYQFGKTLSQDRDPANWYPFRSFLLWKNEYFY